MAKGEAAAKAGVRVNDTVVSIDGEASPAAYEDLRDMIAARGRPVVVGFDRSGSGGGGVEEAGPFQRAQDAAKRRMGELKGPPQVGIISCACGGGELCSYVLSLDMKHSCGW